MKRLRFFVLALLAVISPLLPMGALAADAPAGFSLQVSPSPIILTVKPGESTTTEIRIRNTGTAKEQLKLALREFSVDSATGSVNLKDSTPKNVQDWVTFSDPTFDVNAGELFIQKVTLAVPANAGFSYSFAILISRATPATGSAGKTTIEGSVAIFTLLTVDRPGATKKIEVVSLSSKKKVYEFLPAEFTLQLKNSGNTIIAPSGNVFIQKGNSAVSPIAVLPVNASGAYILPDVTRSVTSSWEDGFPVYKTGEDKKSHLVWDWGTLQKLRMGHFTAKVVVIYNDGTRDIPVEASISFWVIPWRLLIGLFVVLVLITVGVISTVRKTAKLAHKKEKDGQNKV